MIRFLLSTLIFLICSTANAATYYAVATGNWSSTSVWSGSSGGSSGVGPPGANDTAILNAASGSITVTVNAATSVSTLNESGFTGTLAFGTQTLTVGATAGSGVTLQGAMTSTSGTLVVESGGVTLDGTATGSFPTLDITIAAQTLTSNNYTWPGKLTLGYAGTITLLGNWVNTGLLTFTAATNLNYTTNETLTANGGITMTSAAGASPTATIVLGGGTWSATGGTSYLTNNLTFSGNSIISSEVYYETGTITYSSGTITVTGSTLDLEGAATLNTSGMTWGTVILGSGTTTTYTLASALSASELWIGLNGTSTISGNYNITVATLYQDTNSGTFGFVFPAGQTIFVTNVITACDGSATGGNISFKSSVTSSPIYLDYTGTTANQQVCGIAFTDVDANGHTIFNFKGSTLTRTTNITNVNLNNFNGTIVQ